VRDQQRDAVDQATDDAAVGAAPAVLVLEAGEDAADRDDRGQHPVPGRRRADQDAGTDAEKRGNDTG